MIMISVCVVVQETLQRILNSHTYCIYPCHSQTTAMAAIAFFAKVPKWQWHYNPALDSLYLTATSRVCLYIFFYLPFAVSVLSQFFDPEAHFDRIPLYMAHPAALSPQPLPPASMETNPSQASASSSSSSAFGGSGHSPDDPGPSSITANGFFSPELDQGDYAGPFGRPFSQYRFR